VLLPDTPRAGTLPVVVASHGSRGQAGICAPSMLNAAAADVNADFIHQVYPLVGFGYAVIAPDSPGTRTSAAPATRRAPTPTRRTSARARSTASRRSATCCPWRASRSRLSSSATRRAGRPRSRRSPSREATRSAAPSRRSPCTRRCGSRSALGGHLPRADDVPPRQQLRGSSEPLVPRHARAPPRRAGRGTDGIFDPTKFPVVQKFEQTDCWSSSYRTSSRPARARTTSSRRRTSRPSASRRPRSETATAAPTPPASAPRGSHG